jgi:L-aminoadipate-semialdehyde dehydrogenase
MFASGLGEGLTEIEGRSTNFLGAFILRDLLQKERVQKVNCLIRVADGAAALQGLRELSTDRGTWDACWVTAGRVKVVVGDLKLTLFRMRTEVRSGRVAAEAVVVVHNGASVSAYPCLWRAGADLRQV